MFRVKAFCAAVSLATIASFATSPLQAQGSSGPVNWTGFYVGAHGSYMWADQDYPGAPQPKAGPPRHELSGALLGGQIGAQYHFPGGILIGIEGDYSKGNMSSMARDGDAIVQNVEIEFTGTLRARLGLPMNTWMPYITGGIMWQGASFNQSCPNPGALVDQGSHCTLRANNNPPGPFGPYNLTDTQTHTGWVFGGGVEWMVGPRFSVKAEGLRFQMGEETYRLGQTPTGKTLGPAKIDYEGSMFRIGGNYRF